MIRALTLVLLLAACAAAPTRAQEAPPAPPTWAVQWWEPTPRPPNTMHFFIYKMMQECLGIEGRPFSEIDWISAYFILRVGDSERLGGLWSESRSIIVLDHTRFNDPRVVSEELLHSLLGSDGVTDPHEDPRFLRCLIGPYVVQPSDNQ